MSRWRRLPSDLEVTAESPPPAAEAVFGDHLPLARRLVGHLVTSGVVRGLIGPAEVQRIWSRHVLNCAVLSEIVPTAVRVVDIGSGAGLPGLVIAIARPDLDVVLVEPLHRRVVWLEEVAEDLGIDVTVRRARAEELAGALTGQVVTARAVASLDRLLHWGLPLVEPGGQVLAIKGRSAAQEMEAAGPVLKSWGLSGAEVVQCGLATLDVPTTVVRVPVGPGARAPAATSAGRPAQRRQRSSARRKR